MTFNTLTDYDPQRAVLFRGATILTMDERLGELAGDLLVVGDTIQAVGPGLAAPAGAEIVDATDHILMPGFVDGHRHCWQGSLRRLITEAGRNPVERDTLYAAVARKKRA